MSDELMPNEKTNAIDLNELIKKLMNKTILYGIADGYGKITEAESAMIGARDNLVSAIDALRASLAQAQAEIAALKERDRWIPVGEPPAIGVRVQVWMVNDYEVIASYFKDYWKNDAGQSINTTNVIKWRPLPPPP